MTKGFYKNAPIIRVAGWISQGEKFSLKAFRLYDSQDASLHTSHKSVWEAWVQLLTFLWGELSLVCTAPAFDCLGVKQDTMLDNSHRLDILQLGKPSQLSIGALASCKFQSMHPIDLWNMSAGAVKYRACASGLVLTYLILVTTATTSGGLLFPSRCPF